MILAGENRKRAAKQHLDERARLRMVDAIYGRPYGPFGNWCIPCWLGYSKKASQFCVSPMEPPSFVPASFFRTYTMFIAVPNTSSRSQPLLRRSENATMGSWGLQVPSGKLEFRSYQELPVIPPHYFAFPCRPLANKHFNEKVQRLLPDLCIKQFLLTIQKFQAQLTVAAAKLA